MNKIGLFYGTTTCQTEAVAGEIRDAFGPDAEIVLHSLTDVQAETFEYYDRLILGIPTWNIGELQADWDMFFPQFEEIDFSGKAAAIFGLGDAMGYPATFLDAMRPVYDVLTKNGARVVGFWPAEDYEFSESRALIEGQFVGLGLDQDNEPEKTPDRIRLWVEQIKPHFLEKHSDVGV